MDWEPSLATVFGRPRGGHHSSLDCPHLEEDLSPRAHRLERISGEGGGDVVNTRRLARDPHVGPNPPPCHARSSWGSCFYW